jgi:hypothetical protein
MKCRYVEGKYMCFMTANRYHLYLRVSPMKGMERFGVKEKLAPRYIGPFHILKKCGTVIYKLEIPLLLARSS